jgi:hypothetical protein
MDEVQTNPYEHASTCTACAVFVAVVLLIAGALASNIGHARSASVDFDWTAFGIWAGAAGVALTVGLCAAAICKQLVDSLTPPP